MIMIVRRSGFAPHFFHDTPTRIPFDDTVSGLNSKTSKALHTVDNSKYVSVNRQ